MKLFWRLRVQANRVTNSVCENESQIFGVARDAPSWYFQGG